MYTITRKLTMVCLAVVFSVLVYGCGGGDSKQASVETPTVETPTVETPTVETPTVETPTVETPTVVDLSTVSVGLTITPGAHTILPDRNANAGDATFSCPEEGEICEVVVADDGTVTSTGGMVTAMDSAAGMAKLDASSPVDMEMVTTGLIIQTGTFTLQPGGMSDQFDVTFTCPVEGLRCVVTVVLNSDGTQSAMSKGGVATATVSDDGLAKLIASSPVDTSMVTIGLTISPGSYTVQPGDTMDFGDAAFRCPAGGLPCVVTVADDGTAMSGGGVATAMNSAAGYAKLSVANAVDLDELAMMYRTITPGPYTIQPGGNMDIDDANFACPAGGVPCALTVTVKDSVASVTSNGGVATATNSMAALSTIKAIDLAVNLIPTAPVPNPVDPVITEIDDTTGVITTHTMTRSTDGSVTKITLGQNLNVPIEYTSEVVDAGHVIDGWDGHTLKRNSGSTAMPRPDEVTVYTSIEPATPGKLKYGGTGAPAIPMLSSYQFVLDAGQDMDDGELADEFTGIFIAGSSRIPGTFTCRAGDQGTCTNPTTETNSVSGERVIATFTTTTDWTFESDANHQAGAKQDTDYTYFGYWLQDPIANSNDYTFAAFSGGNAVFDMSVLGDDDADDDALIAKYNGGAAGRYVTRKLEVKDQKLDPLSPGYHGHFTAKAALTANFGNHPDFVSMVDDESVDVGNTISGTITDFKDGGTDLGFKVVLNSRTITNSNTGIIGAGADAMVLGASAEFSETLTNSASTATAGDWSGAFFGPNAAGATATTEAEDAETKLPSGVAGEFNVSSTYTKVVGAFAAELQE